MLNTRTSWVCVTVLGPLAVSGSAQNMLDWRQAELTPYVLDSGKINNPERDSSVVFEKTVKVEDAVWIRLYFSGADLRPGSYVRMTSLFDGEIQELDADDLAMWDYASAFFNGGSVHLELIAAPGSSGNRIAIDQVAVHVVQDGLRGSCRELDCGICGGDDRVPSNELWAARLMPIGCTASIYNVHSCAVTAGHCSSGGGDAVLQFNVPESNQYCDIVNPPVADQFPVTDRMFFVLGAVDWSALTVGTNSQGETPYERYGVYRPIASAPASVGCFVEVWSYGIDDSTEPTRSQTQQYSTGSPLAVEQHFYLHNADVPYGSSGAALLHNGEIIGVISSCPPVECFHVAARIDIPEFAAARETLCPSGCSISLFADCMSGPGQPLAPDCEPADIDGDNDADMVDFAAFQLVFGDP